MRDEEKALRIVLCWHMHQPEYREPLEGRYLAPWTYLHAIKDYSDMAAHLEREPGAVAVLNFSPILLDQLDDYRLQLEGFFSGRSGLRDPLLAALGDPVLPVGEDNLRSLMHACLRLQRRRMVDRFPGFQRLAEMADWVLAHPDMSHYIDTRLVGDLLVWYHLAWLGESIRERDPRAQRLAEKGRSYDSEDRRELLGLVHEVITAIPQRYRALMERKQIEISMNPYGHPI
ncbi:MAG TPA: glycoside hydrolase, partial [Gammaproteobacteria bacterium]|nr:glycoside hydrolase [Gammaproteobacteria bacterium]